MKNQFFQPFYQLYFIDTLPSWSYSSGLMPELKSITPKNCSKLSMRPHQVREQNYLYMQNNCMQWLYDYTHSSSFSFQTSRSPTFSHLVSASTFLENGSLFSLNWILFPWCYTISLVYRDRSFQKYAICPTLCVDFV